MLKLLLKKQLTEIFRAYFYDAKKNRARSKAGVTGCILLFAFLMVGILGGIFTILSLSMCGVLSEAGVDWLYFSIMGLLAVMLGTFGSVFTTYSCLYLPKDNDLILSLPIPAVVVMASRLLTVYVMGLMYSLVVILPAFLVYSVIVSASAGVIFGSVLLMLLISVFVMTLSCALGWVVAKISLKLKYKSIVTVAASLVFIVGYYFFYFKAQLLILDLLKNAVSYGVHIKSTAYPLYLFGRVAIGDVYAIAVVSAVIFGLFILMWFLLAHSFLKITTASGNIRKTTHKVCYVKPKRVSSALLSKELARFVSSPTYMLNCGLGILLLPIFGIALLWKGDTIVSALNDVFDEHAGFVPVLLSAAVCMLSSMNGMTAPSVSLEGKSLWIVQSLPLSPWQILRAKLRMQLLLTVIPVLFCVVCIAFVYSYSIIELIFALLVPITFVLLYAQFGLSLGLKMPNLNHTSEITPIKQSAGVAFTSLGGFGYAVLMFVGFLLTGGQRTDFVIYMSVFIMINIALCVLLHLWLRGKGCRRFISL